MDKRLMLSFATISHHVANFRRITPEMLEDISLMDNWYRQKIIEKYDEIVCSLLDILEDINIKSSDLYSNGNT